MTEVVLVQLKIIQPSNVLLTCKPQDLSDILFVVTSCIKVRISNIIQIYRERFMYLLYKIYKNRHQGCMNYSFLKHCELA